MNDVAFCIEETGAKLVLGMETPCEFLVRTPPALSFTRIGATSDDQ